MVTLPTRKQDIMKGLIEPPFGGLLCTDEEAMERQKGVLVDVVKQLAITLLKGLTIAHISLPIKIFEPRSSIQRIVDIWSFAPKFLKAAAETTDQLERFKQVIAFSMSSLYICTAQYKPFNPILGETLQGQFPDGTQIFCEHTSHHPPITNFHLHPEDSSYEYWGYYEMTGSMGANHLKSGLRGPNNVKFADGQHIRFKSVDFKLGGTVMGERTIEATGHIIFEDLTNNRKAVIVMSTYKKTGFWKKTESGKKDEFNGIIYESEPITNPKATSKLLYGKNATEITDLNQIKDMVKPICEIKGSWLRSLSIGGKKYWDIDGDLPFRQLPLVGETVLPSDWRYREDLLWLKYDYMKIAQKWKFRMEEQQRHDRRLRLKRKEERARGE